MTDIQALKKAAALQKSDLLTDRFDYITALRDPATVLELCRLAEIGEAVERTAKGDENGYLEIPKFLRRKEQP